MKGSDVFMRNPNIVSQAQIEVWEMKDKLYENVKDLPLSEALKEILTKSQKAMEIYNKN
ncbi:MAG: hypothetical protein NT007_00685 [Candidatus Kapabacteria bacterium]|nr:hypothetical protein [Candidatus Kapabacteria bacterium]